MLFFNKQILKQLILLLDHNGIQESASWRLSLQVLGAAHAQRYSLHE
jgi:hypothetical protein